MKLAIPCHSQNNKVICKHNVKVYIKTKMCKTASLKLCWSERMAKNCSLHGSKRKVSVSSSVNMYRLWFANTLAMLSSRYTHGKLIEFNRPFQVSRYKCSKPWFYMLDDRHLVTCSIIGYWTEPKYGTLTSFLQETKMYSTRNPSMPSVRILKLDMCVVRECIWVSRRTCSAATSNLSNHYVVTPCTSRLHLR